MRHANAQTLSAALDDSCTLDDMRDAAKRVIKRALRQAEGNRTYAAAALKVSHDRLWKWLRDHPDLAADWPAEKGNPTFAHKKR